MKQIITLLFILSITSIYSQKGIISYIATLKEPINFNEKEYSEEKQKMILEAINSSDDIEYTLTINKGKSLFIKIEEMEKENRTFNMTNLLAGDTFYSNLQTKENIEHKYTFGKDFLISNKKINWNLTSETKKIKNYNCRKATATIKIENRRGVINKKIIAWYTPDIPLNFGPKFYNGLPGLILKLHEGKLTFNVSKIILNPKKNIVIKKPSKGKLITRKELNNIARELRNR